MALQQQVQYVMTLNDLTGSVFKNAEQNALRFEGVVNNLNSGLKTLGSVLGVGIGFHYFKSAIDDFAKYETALIRIKNASKDAADGVVNQQFIMSEAMKYKIPIDEATESYGKFLAQVSNSGLASEKIRSLHDDVLAITKTLGLPQGKMDAAVYDIGKMLGEGVLEAKSTRALERVMPQLTSLLADQLGVDRKVLSQAMSSGKYTKAGISSDVILDMFHDLAGRLSGGLPEALQSTQSAMNEVYNAWLMFKVDVIQDLKPELLGLMEGIKSVTHWLHEHKGAVEGVVSVLAKVIPAYLLVKTSIGAYNGLASIFLANSAKEVTATEAKAVAYNQLALAMERVAFASESIAASQIASFTPWAGGVGGTAAATAATGEAGLLGMSFVGGALLVSLTAASIAAIGIALADHSGHGKSIDPELGARIKPRMIDQRTGSYNLNGSDTSWVTQKAIVYDTLLTQEQKASYALYEELKKQGKFKDQEEIAKNISGKKPTTLGKHNDKLFAENDKVTGNRPITYNITIQEMNGVNNSTFELTQLSKADTNEFGKNMLQELIGVVNDVQIRQGY